MEENTNLTLRDLLELAHNGEAAEFTALIREALDATAEDAVRSMMVEDPEDEDDELDFDFDSEDDISDIDEEEMEEGHSFSRKSFDDDTIRVKGGAKKFSHRQERRKWKVKLEDVEPGTLQLADDLTDEELQELADSITEDHFDLLDTQSQEMLVPFLTSEGDDDEEND